MKTKFIKLLKEMIPVILGILIALLINNWNEQRKDMQYINKLMYSIEKELEENKAELLSTINEHRQLIDTLNYYQGKEVTIGEIINRVEGIRGVSVKNNAWKALMHTRIELLDHEKISILTDIDEEKQDMKLRLEKLLDFIYEKLDSTKLIDQQLFKIIIVDLLHVELEMLESHEKFLKKKNEPVI